MADKKISELNAASTLVGTELLPVVQDGETVKAAVTDLSIASLDYFTQLGIVNFIGPSRLFLKGEQGTWYDPSDFSSMYQDSAGTTPVTAVEQPVGKILDKSGNGNHATQSTTTSRPILRNLYNLLSYTEQFDNAVWAKVSASVTANSTTAPDGTNTADTITAVGTSAFVFYNVAVGSATTQNTVSICLKSASSTTFSVRCNRYGTSDYFQADGDLSTLTVTSSTGGTGSVTVQPVLQSLGSGWYRLTISGVASTTAGGCSWAFTNTPNIYAWGASLVPANEASLPYQRVVTNTLGSGVYDSDTTKFPPYLYFDGTDDFLVTGNINFSATDTMSVFAGVRKLSDAAAGFIAELSSAIDNYAGTFGMVAPNVTTTNRFAFVSRGSLVSAANATGSTYNAPITSVVTGLSAISTDYCVLRISGVQVASTASDQGTGNYASAQPLYIGRRGGTTMPFNGRIYSLITRGALTETPLLEKTEQWVATKTGVTL